MTLIMPDTAGAVARDLRRLIGAEKVRDDAPTLAAYAVDASIYRLVPQAVASVESEEDIQQLVRYAVRQGVPLTPRAAGTNLTGSAIGTGIILDVSRMNRILDVNRDERWARVQPGIVFAELNRRLSRQGLLFGPDPSSGDMCKLGGMLANNSSGPHTLRYGSVKDNVLDLRICLSTGDWVDAKPYPLLDAQFPALLRAHPALAQTWELVKEHAAAVRAREPRVSKNSCGYNLFALTQGLDRGICDWPRLFIGSEGTLGVMSEARLQLAPCPKASATGLVHFHRLDDVGDAVAELVTLRPSALEVMDGNTLNLIGRAAHGIPAEAAATLLVELDEEDDPRRIQETADRVAAICRRYRLAGEPVLAYEREQRDALWKARKALYPTLYRYDGKKKPINYVDDVVVRAERISELIRYLEETFGSRDVPVAIFGHIGNGNAHVVPLLDVNDRGDFAKMVETYHAIHETVLTRFEGSICGEHGDGRVRAELVRRMFGEDLYSLFVQVKRNFDPTGVLNPGVKLSDQPFTEHIDYTRLSKSCATCAKCNSVCPVYDVFQTEDMSSRGWYEIVTAKDYSYLNSKRVVEACLNCKSCRTICPAGVDVSELILQKRAEQPNKLAGWIFRLQAKARWFEPALRLAGRTQWLWDRAVVRWFLDWLTRPVLRALAPTARFSRDLLLPRLAGRHLRARHADLVKVKGQPGQPRVAYFHGCAANYFDDGVGDAVIQVLRAQGIEPELPPQRCSGTPVETYGHVELAKEGARFNLQSLEPYETVVTGCASCTLMLKDYTKFFKEGPEKEAAENLAKKVRHITEIAAARSQPAENGQGGATCTPRVTYHSSCHLRAAGVTKEPRKVLAALPGVTYVEMQDADRCAGGAGTYLLKDPATASAIFERKRRAIQESGADVVATSCPACMIQLKNGLRGRVEVKHVAQLLSEGYGPNARKPHYS